MAKDGNNGREDGQDKRSKRHPHANEQTRVTKKGMAEAAPRTKRRRVMRKSKRDRAPRTTNINEGRVVPWARKGKRDRAPRTTNIHFQSLPKRLSRSTAKRSSMKTAATQKGKYQRVPPILWKGMAEAAPRTATATTARVRTIPRRMGQAEARQSRTRIDPFS